MELIHQSEVTGCEGEREEIELLRRVVQMDVLLCFDL